MLEVYAFSTPNSVKVPIALEELALDYTLHPVNIRAGGQKTPEFTTLNPNAKVPVLVDPSAPGGPLTLTESAAILVYLAEKTGRLLPASGPGRARVFEQLFFHASGLSPAFGNVGFFRKFAPEPIPLAIDRFGGEALRIVGLLDGILARQSFAAGDELSIADIANSAGYGGASSPKSHSTTRRTWGAGTMLSKRGLPSSVRSRGSPRLLRTEEAAIGRAIIVDGASARGRPHKPRRK